MRKQKLRVNNSQDTCPDSRATPEGEEGAGDHLTGAEEGVGAIPQATITEDLYSFATHATSQDIWSESATPRKS